MSTVAVGPFPEGRRASAAWLLLAALGCGLVAGTVAVRAVDGARRELAVVVARRDVTPMSRIAGGDVQIVRMPTAALPAGTERTLGPVVGQFTRAGLVPGEVVTAAALAGAATDAGAEDVRLTAAGGPPCAVAPTAAGPVPAPAPKGTGTSATRTGASGVTPTSAAAGAAQTPAKGDGACANANLVAMTLPVAADQGFAMVQRGDRVDLVASYSLAQGPAAQVIVADVPVLDRVGSAQSPGTAGSAAPQSGWLVLALTQRDALRVQLAEAAGKVAVLLRPLGAAAEDPQVTARVLTVPDLAAGSATPEAPPLTAGALPPPAASQS